MVRYALPEDHPVTGRLMALLADPSSYANKAAPSPPAPVQPAQAATSPTPAPSQASAPGSGRGSSAKRKAGSRPPAANKTPKASAQGVTGPHPGLSQRHLTALAPVAFACCL